MRLPSEPAVWRNVESGISSQLTNIDDVGGEGSGRCISRCFHNLRFSRSFVNVGTSLRTPVVYRPSSERSFFNGGKVDLRVHQSIADSRELEVVFAFCMLILLKGNKTRAIMIGVR